MAIRALRAADVAFVPHQYPWEAHGGTAASARHLGVDEHLVIKTLIFEDERKRPLCVLMHGDREVSTKQVARQIGVKSVAMCAPAAATRHTGYLVGGTSPFGMRKALPVYAERTILALERIAINGGRRGLLVAISPTDLVRVLRPTPIDAVVPRP